MKKAQGLSLNTIIIAAIVLIVLVVLWAIFTGRMGGFTAGLKEQRPAECPGDNWVEACTEGQTLVVPDDAAEHPGLVCCKTV